jgi:signal transduction histidine kinase
MGDVTDQERIARLEAENASLRASLAAANVALATAQNALADAQKKTALGDLMGTTTHEFNNVLTTVLNYARMGLRHTDPETTKKSFEKILAAGERAARITRSVLGMARNRSGGFERVDLRSVVEETMVLLERELSKYRISVDYDLADVPAIEADGNRLQQTLLNLLVNARQAMPSGGTLYLRLAHSPEESLVELTVRDTGCGIPTDKLPRIFDGYTSKSGPDETGKGGTGVGLALCKETIEAHHGRIRVESAVGKGTAFILKLPVDQPRSVEVPVATPVRSRAEAG